MRKALSVFAISLSTVIGVQGVSRAGIDITSGLPDYVDSISIGGGTEQFYLAHQNAYGVDGEDYEWIDYTFRLNTTVKMKSSVEFKFGILADGTAGNDVFSSVYGLGGIEPFADGPEYTGNNNSDFMVDEAYIKFRDIADLPVDVTVGRHQISIEKSFLVDDQNHRFDTNVYGNASRTSPFAAKVDLHLEPVTVEIYGGRIGTDDEMAQFLFGDDLHVYGINLHYDINEKAYLYGGVVDYQSSTSDGYDNDTIDYYLGGDFTLGGWNFSGEYAHQVGTDDISDSDRNANAAFAFLKYTFEKTQFIPFVEAGGFYFSGDDPSTRDNEGFDTRNNTGFPDMGKYCPGEAFGEQVFFAQNNYYTFLLQGGLMPTETTMVRLQYFNTYWDEKDNVFGVSVSDDKAADEFNLVLEWFPNPNLYVGVVLGVGFPSDGLSDYYGDDQATTMAGTYLVYNF